MVNFSSYRSVFLLVLEIVTLACVVTTAGDALAQQVRVATYNLNFANRQLDAALEAINEAAADVLLLQETTVQSESTIKSKLSNEYPHFHSAGHLGNYYAERFAFASKQPMEKVRFVPPKHGLFGFYLAQTKLRDRQVQLVNVHLSPIQVSRQGGISAALQSINNLQSVHQRELEEIVKELDHTMPIVIAGDFNGVSKSAEHAYLKQAGFTDAQASVQLDADREHTWRWPTGALPLVLRIDYVQHNDKFKAVDAKVIRRPGSDHFLLVSTLEFN